MIASRPSFYSSEAAAVENGFLALLSAHRQRGICSVCSAHPWVIQAAAEQAMENGGLVLIEATCNQVNQEGGYTGMRPADFRDFVLAITDRAGLPRERLILGGDHLGPHVWRKLAADEAMARAEIMIGQYAQAGFAKIHLDTSMACAGDPAILSDPVIAARAAKLARAAEAKHAGTPPFYIVGTEVPVPGGASHGHELAVTKPQAAAATLAIHREAFLAAGLGDAWRRVVGLVVQPGVEFDNVAVIDYAPEKAQDLAHWRRDQQSGILFEAHSTDFQRPDAFKNLVADGFAILKVGPGVTFAMREAVCALAEIEKLVVAPERQSRLLETIHAVMLENPVHWKDYYSGDGAELENLLFNSYSDRIRYYWPDPRIGAAMTRLVANLAANPAPDILLSRYLPSQYRKMREGRLARSPEALILDKVRDALRPYAAACTI